MNNSIDDTKPSLYNGTIAWDIYTDGNYAIYYRDGSSE